MELLKQSLNPLVELWPALRSVYCFLPEIAGG
jgi:hypothetical protein